MFITYYWVENWLKLMTACAEQLQPLAADGDARTAVEAELIQLRDALADSQAAVAAAVQERGELQAELKRQRLQAEAERADHARQLTDNASAAEKRLGEQAATREAAQAEAKRLREDVKAVQARAEQAAKEAKGQSERLVEEIAALRRERQAAVAQADALRAENERLAAEIAPNRTAAESLRLELGAIQEKLQAALTDAADARRVADGAHPPVQDSPPAEHHKTPKRARKPSGTAARAVSPTAAKAANPAAAKAANPAGLALRFRKPADWAEPVHVHYWNTDPAVAEPVWPGTAMSDEGEGWWAHQIEGARTASLVFNDAAGHQTGNLHRDRSGSLESDGAWVDDA